MPKRDMIRGQFDKKIMRDKFHIIPLANAKLYRKNRPKDGLALKSFGRSKKSTKSRQVLLKSL